MFRHLILITFFALSSIYPSWAAEVNSLDGLQNNISKNIESLKNAKGELKAITEFRIKEETKIFRKQLDSIVDEEAKVETYLPIIKKQNEILKSFNNYLEKDISTMAKQLGGNNDSQIMLNISQRSLEQNGVFKQQLELISWVKKLGADVTSLEEDLKNKLLARTDKVKSLLSYNQQQLNVKAEQLKDIGADVTTEQTEALYLLKERLANNNDNLKTLIALLEKLGENTNELKKTAFAISGDITKDVLDIDVASGLVRQWISVAKTYIFENGPSLLFKVIVFVFIIFIASLISKLIQRLVSKAVSNSKLRFSKLLQDFFISLSAKIVFALGLLIALSQLGFELGPLLAGFGIAGVIIGFALQDTLSNFASGMMILIYRPFDVGDLIDAAGVTGKVSHMSLVSTTIKTLDNQRLIVPNNKIWGDTINNITAEHVRRVDMTFGIGYSDDIDHADKLLHDIIMSHPKVLKSPEPLIKLHTLGESSVDFIVRPWTKPGDYWEVYWDVTRTVKKRFDAEGISIPFPQRDVHIYQQNMSEQEPINNKAD